MMDEESVMSLPEIDQEQAHLMLELRSGQTLLGLIKGEATPGTCTR